MSFSTAGNPPLDVVHGPKAGHINPGALIRSSSSLSRALQSIAILLGPTNPTWSIFVLGVASSPARLSSWQGTSLSTVNSSRSPPWFGGFPAWPRLTASPTCQIPQRVSSSRRFFGGLKELTAAARNRLSPLRARCWRSYAQA